MKVDLESNQFGEKFAQKTFRCCHTITASAPEME